MLNRLRFAEKDSNESCGWRLNRVRVRKLRRGRGSQPAVYQPPTDVYETDRQVVVRLEIAGLEPDDFEVLVSNEAEVLTIAGKRPDPAGGAHRKYFNMEIECGDFARQLRIPAPIVSDQISATYADGFLTITMPKQSDNSSSARNVPIS